MALTCYVGNNLNLYFLKMDPSPLGAKYAEVGCKSMDTFGCMSMPFGCMSMARLGAKYAVVGCKVCGGCMQMDTIGCMYAAFGCMSMERLGACLTVGSFA